MPLLKNKEALKIQPLQIELTIQNHNNQPPPGLAAGSRKLVMAKPPRDDSDDPPSLKTGCKNFNFCRTKAIVNSSIAFSIVITWLYRGHDKSNIFSTA